MAGGKKCLKGLTCVGEVGPDKAWCQEKKKGGPGDKSHKGAF